MLKNKSEKLLGNGKPSSFYKNFKLLRIKPVPCIKTQQKIITIQNSPCNYSINKSQIDYLIKRLNDTPDSLYSAIQHKSLTKHLFNKNKFKPISNLSLNNTNSFNSKSLNYTAILPPKIDKNTEADRYHTMLKHLKNSKKKYVQQYRTMLFSMPSTFIDQIAFPKIQYIQQNEFTDKINKMHRFTKQKK